MRWLAKLSMNAMAPPARPRGVRAGVAFVASLAVGMAFGAGIEPETVTSAELGPPAPTWFIVRSSSGSGFVFDAADGKMYGTLSLTPWTPTVRRHPRRPEIYAAETHYSRRYDGERTDVLRVYAHDTLAPVAEIPVPNKIAPLNHHYLGILSDGRHVTVFNLAPSQSVTVVDVENRRLAGEISTSGCAMTLPAGERGFLMLCGDGSLQWIGLDERGAEAARSRTEPFFSVQEDPLFDKATPSAAGWQLMSYAGLTMEAVVRDGEIVVGESWSLLGEGDAGWRPGGSQPAAYHAGHDLLVALMHEGGVDTQDEDGSEAWVFDRGGKRRIGRIEFENPASALLVVDGEQPLLLAAIDEGVHVHELRTGRRQRIIGYRQRLARALLNGTGTDAPPLAQETG